MDTPLMIDVTTLDAAHRRALEDVVGQELHNNERLIISVAQVPLPSSSDVTRSKQSLDDWTSIYRGLTDDQIEAIDRDVNTRADLARNVP